MKFTSHKTTEEYPLNEIQLSLKTASLPQNKVSVPQKRIIIRAKPARKLLYHLYISALYDSSVPVCGVRMPAGRANSSNSSTITRHGYRATAYLDAAKVRFIRYHPHLVISPAKVEYHIQ